MSGKFSKKRTKKKSLRGLWIVLIAVAAIFALVIGMALLTGNGEKSVSYATPDSQEPMVSVPEEITAPVSITEYILANTLRIDNLGSYTGIYMEDGSDELVSGIMRITVTNIGDQALQYADVTLSGPAGEAEFKFSTLKPGESAVVLEANRKPYSNTDVYTTAATSGIVFFQEELSLQEDKLQIQPLDGGFNITNVSGEDIAGEITVYFKDSAAGMYYGGITYRGRVQGGMKAGEIRQIMSENFSDSGTTVVFITITE